MEPIVGKLNRPITKGVAKVPVVMQMESLECGAAALAMILAHYGKWMPLEHVRLSCGVSRDGTSIENLAKAARSYGLEASGYYYGGAITTWLYAASGGSTHISMIQLAGPRK